MDTTVFASLVAATILLNFAVAFVRNRNTSFPSYSSDPNNHGALAITTSLVGTIVGGGMFLAVGTMGFEAGVLGYIVGLVYFLGMLIMGAYTTKIRRLMERSNVSTLLDLIGTLISNRSVRLFSLVSFILYLFLLSGQFIAIKIVATYLSAQFGGSTAPYWLAAFAVVVLFLYPVAGGLRKDIQTDLFQVLLIGVACFVIGLSFFSHPVQQLHWDLVPAKLLTGTAYGPIFLIGLVLFYTPSFLVRMDFWQRVIAAKTDTAAKTSFIVAGTLAFIFFMFFTTIGIWGNVTGIADAKFATMKVLEREVTGAYSYGIVIGAFFAAVLSSADTFINNVSLFMARFFHRDLWQAAMSKPNSPEEKGILWRSRGYAVVAMFLSLILATLVPDLVDLLVAAFSLLLIFLPMILGVLFERWRSEAACFYSSLVGLTVFVVLFVGWNQKLAFAPAVVLALLMYIALFNRGARKQA